MSGRAASNQLPPSTIKIVDAAQMRALDQATFTRIGTPSVDVMECAGRSCAELLLSVFPDEVKKGVSICAGSGNNAGDGFVVARLLKEQGIAVRLHAVKAAAELSGDAKHHALLWEQTGAKTELIENQSMLEAELASAGVIVDALLGTGIDAAARGLIATVIETVNAARGNATPGKIFSIDIPSGLSSNTGVLLGSCVKADLTAAIQCLKWGHVEFPAAAHCGDVYLVDAGISLDVPEAEAVRSSLITSSWVAERLRKIFTSEADLHKGIKGHLLAIGGSMGHYGAIKMSAMAGFRAGAGLVTLMVPADVAKQIAAELFELMSASLPNDAQGGFAEVSESLLAELVAGKDAVVLGPGIGQGAGVRSLIATLFSFAELPLVIDADALNVLAVEKELQSELRANVVLTPHPGEMARLTGLETSEIQSNRVAVATEYSKRWGCWLVLKGARTVVASPCGASFINPAASEVLATAGSGDVLAGVIGAFAAREIDFGSAVASAVFAHGATANLLEKGPNGAIGHTATDILECVPRVINSLISMDKSSDTLPFKVLPGRSV